MTKELSSKSDDKEESTITDVSSNTEEKVGTFSSLRIRNFRFLLTGTVISNAAQWIQQVTLSWLIYDLTGSGTMLGSINAVRSLALLGMIPIAGVLIDIDHIIDYSLNHGFTFSLKNNHSCSFFWSF